MKINVVVVEHALEGVHVTTPGLSQWVASCVRPGAAGLFF